MPDVGGLTFLMPIIIGVIMVAVLGAIVYKLLGIRVVKPDQVGIVSKWWSRKGSIENGIIALNGEAGWQPEVLRGGVHFRTPLMYRVHMYPLVTIPQGQIGYIFARDGIPLPPDQTLGKVIPGNNFQDVKVFMENGGQKGPQRAILREGTYAFNLAQFIILTEGNTYYMPMGDQLEENMIHKMADTLVNRGGFRPVVIGAQGSSRSSEYGEVGSENSEGDKMGIVTVHDGPSLHSGDIIAPVVGEDEKNEETYHNNFQDPEKFLAAGGLRGKQYQALTDGTYFINRLFATVELRDKTVVQMGSVGVVVSYVGEKGADVSGADYSHGELVANGERGVWQTPYMPGKYAFNEYAGKIRSVPTTNIILKWIEGEEGDHKFDSGLSEIELITQDAFEILLPLTVVIHIDYKMASLVIQRFAEIDKLVNDTLDPMVASYFKNKGQQQTLLDLIQKRTEIQTEATQEMKDKFAAYNLELQEVLIGTPRAKIEGDEGVETILSQLKDRQIAVEQITTYQQQKLAADEQKNLTEAQATAERQKSLTESLIDITVKENKGKADAAAAEQEAKKIEAIAKAEGTKAQVIGDGEAHAIEAKAKAFQQGGAQRQLSLQIAQMFTDAIASGNIPLVPETLVTMGGSGNGNGGGDLPNGLSLLTTLLNLKELGIDIKPDDKKPGDNGDGDSKKVPVDAAGSPMVSDQAPE
ncbi:MAG: SPFH domain-containing protein [bacterium]|nr:SPFH domain-containing protein [bacterium]